MKILFKETKLEMLDFVLYCSSISNRILFYYLV